MKRILFLLLSFAIFACSSEKTEVADTIFQNGKIYTVNEAAPEAEAVAVKDGMIIYVGTSADAQKFRGEQTQVVDLDGKTMTPGLIESHGHFMGLGYNELELDLMYVKNYDELVEKVAEAVAKAEPGEWITGRGWHQSKWDKLPEETFKGFQTHDKLSAVSPENPVWLRHASGHAAFANEKAMSIAGVNQLSVEQIQGEIEGGEIIRDDLGNPTGIFTETAMATIWKYVPQNTEEKDRKALELAIKAAQRNGITSFHDAGESARTIELYQQFKDEGKLGTRLYVMLTGRQPELLEEWYVKGPMIDSTDHLLTVRSIKLNCDGALGSRGAWLIEDYTDRPGHVGAPTISFEFVGEVSKKGLEHGFQVCSHAIGDRANREVLDRYEAAFDEYPGVEDHRFRIEHAQHFHPDDLPRMAEHNVIAAMQAIHMSSDRPWAIDRLGEQRIVDGAYMWQTLLSSGVKVINGTDVPVEPIDPIPSFYASISRKTLEGTPEEGYEPAERMTRAQALKSYTLDAAYGEFEEDYKGSIEVGKAADLTVYNQDLMTVPEQEVLDTKVVMTVLGGEIVFEDASE